MQYWKEDEQDLISDEGILSYLSFLLILIQINLLVILILNISKYKTKT